MHENNYPKLHNASWPGVVGKGPGSEPPISIDTMIDLTTNAEVDGVKFDGFDLFLFDPHMDIDSSDDGIKQMADKAMAKNLEIGSLVAPGMVSYRWRISHGFQGGACSICDPSA